MPKFKIAPQTGLIICHVRISGRGKPVFLKMALDTGSTKTIIPPEAATAIGANPAYSRKTTEITTGSGTVICPIIRIAKFSCLGFTRRKMDVVCHNLPAESPVEGLLGLDFFKNYRIILDLRRNILEVTK